MRILVLPRDPNPYQESLYAPMRARGAEVAYLGGLTRSRTLNLVLLPAEIAVRRLAGWRTLHLHWVFGFALPWAADRPGLRRLSRLWFGLTLRLVRALRMTLVWTAHNTLPHDRVFPDDAEARRALVGACDLVIAHSPATLEALASIGARPRRSVVVPHGPSAPALAGAPAPRPPDGATRLLFLGKVLPYKGVEDLLTALADVPPRPALTLTVAGACPDEGLRRRLGDLAAASPHPVDLDLGFVPDDEVPARLAAADAVVLPFRRVTTSGSALLALGHGRPLVIPDLPALADIPAAAAVRYDGTGPGLAGALARLASSGPEGLVPLAAAARAHAETLPGWDAIAVRTVRAIAEART